MGIAIPRNVPRHGRNAPDAGSEWSGPGRFIRVMNRFLLGCVAAWLATIVSALGASASFELTVEAGMHDRRNVPLRVPMQRSRIGNEPIASVTLACADGQTIPAQWTGPN